MQPSVIVKAVCQETCPASVLTTSNLRCDVMMSSVVYTCNYVSSSSFSVCTVTMMNLSLSDPVVGDVRRDG